MVKIEYANLDALRSVAIMTVLIDHLVPTLHTLFQFGSPTLLGLTGHIGQAGVLAFFVHTSIVLMMSLERMGQESDSTALRFYIRRAFRIYPLAWVVMALAVLASIPSNTWRDPDLLTPQAIWANVLLIQNVWTKKQILQPLWSLAYEMQMYLVLPVLFAMVTQRKGLTWLSLSMLAAVVGGSILAQLTAGRMNMAAYLPCFIAGVWCYGVLRQRKPILPSEWWLPLILVLTFLYAWSHRQEVEPVYWQGWIFCAVLAGVIPLFANIEQPLIKRISHEIAKYSYGMYLLHVPVLYLVFKYLQVPDLMWGSVLFFVLTALASFVAYHLVEEPFINMGRKITTSTQQTGLTPT